MKKIFNRSILMLAGFCLTGAMFSCADDDLVAMADFPTPILTSISPLSGTKGTQVTITGSKFSTNPLDQIVKFNGKSAVVLSASETQLVVVVPDQAGDGDITVRRANNTVMGAFFDYEMTYTVSTFAGSTNGTADGAGTGAQFADPWDLVQDAEGNFYITDYDSHRIRKVTPNGVVTTLAGSTAGYADGTAAQAQFDGPTAIAIDAAGNLYVTEYTGHRIRKITPAGEVSTVAGSGVEGFADGAAAEAQFSKPSGIAVDAAGNLYVGDKHNHRIRKITPDGQVSTLAGSGTEGFADGLGEAAQFNNPAGLTIDGDGNLYLADTDNERVRKVTPDGEVSTVAGSGIAGFADGPAEEAQFNETWDVWVANDGVLYIADYKNHRIRMITTDGTVRSIAGSGEAGKEDGVEGLASFNQPGGITMGIDGHLYVADNRNFLIRKITID
ncbi:MAG: IPT/TIG domain-containing protein [Bacteroidetes bacterium]|nr:IPT/TIG domain-containing protein [Bacteroidota bacterium]